MLKSFLKNLDKQTDRLGNFIVSKRHIITPIFSFGLGSITAFYLRDEFNYPTYLRI